MDFLPIENSCKQQKIKRFAILSKMILLFHRYSFLLVSGHFTPKTFLPIDIPPLRHFTPRTFHFDLKSSFNCCLWFEEISLHRHFTPVHFTPGHLTPKTFNPFTPQTFHWGPGFDIGTYIMMPGEQLDTIDSTIDKMRCN